MEYTVQKLARLAGVSARTLRFYDEIGLLKPARTNSSGYRIYGEKEVDTLQQILFFRALGLELGTIAEVMRDPSFNRLEALRSHREALEAKRQQLSSLIENVNRTIEKEEGKTTMTDKEKFEGFKQQLVDDNERKYGDEIRAKYGDDVVNESNAKMRGMSKDQYEAMQAATVAMQEKLAEAVRSGADAKGDAGKEVARMHKDWLGYSWTTYSAEAHKGLAQMYLDDERFMAYYDKEVPGCAQFLRDAVHAWVDKL